MSLICPNLLCCDIFNIFETFYCFYSLMKGRDEDGFLEFQERLIRQSLKEFPYVSSALLQQLVRQIAPVKIVSTRIQVRSILMQL